MKKLADKLLKDAKALEQKGAMRTRQEEHDLANMQVKMKLINKKLAE